MTINKIVLTCLSLSLLIIITNPMLAQNTDFRHMIEAAIKAPSGHNTQPWKFKMLDDGIEIMPDLTRTLSVVDADNRELFISLGCAAENIQIAATTLGYQSEVKINENGSIIVQLHKADVTADPLFKQIEKRQTNRNIYDSRIITDITLQSCLKAVPVHNNVKVYNWKRSSPEFDILAQSIFSGNRIQMGNDHFKDELKTWMRFNRKDADLKLDGLSYDVFGAPNLPKFISKPAMSSYLNSKKQNKADTKKIESASHFILFTTTDNQISNWITLGMYLQRFLLKLTEEGIAHSYMNQPCEVKNLQSKLVIDLEIGESIPQILLRIGYGKAASYSRRRGLETVIVN